MISAESELFAGDNVESLCDFTFGDVAGTFHQVPRCRFKRIRMNPEFERLLTVSSPDRVINVFVDTVRLCRRIAQEADPVWRKWDEKMMKDGTLLEFLAKFPSHKFRIFSALDDRHVPPEVHYQIPDNVVEIKSINVDMEGNKIKAMPYGIPRRPISHEDKWRILLEAIKRAPDVTPEDKLYTNFSPYTNPVRAQWAAFFSDKPWVVHRQGLPYEEYINDMLKYKFILCPPGKAIDCHRNMEAVLLGRVPVFIETPYCTKIYRTFRPISVDRAEYLGPHLFDAYNSVYSNQPAIDIPSCRDFMFNYTF